ncbi:hypothetical protein B0H19DRAFT_1080658 [Mycena capillaripes]|nr:hypothetical protein B0H19DRAFT_1080658 [Mycena capillaripes]
MSKENRKEIDTQNPRVSEPKWYTKYKEEERFSGLLDPTKVRTCRQRLLGGVGKSTANGCSSCNLRSDLSSRPIVRKEIDTVHNKTPQWHWDREILPGAWSNASYIWTDMKQLLRFCMLYKSPSVAEIPNDATPAIQRVRLDPTTRLGVLFDTL